MLSDDMDLSNYLNKDVYIVLNNDNVTNSYLFSTLMKTVGQIIDYDENGLFLTIIIKVKERILPSI